MTLDNPVWSSLTTLHRAYARGAGDVLRFPADVAPFIATGHGGAPPAELVEPGETVFAIGPRPATPSGWHVEDLGTITQMVSSGPITAGDGPAIVPLDEHAGAVRELAALVYPHYFRHRTMELGRYFGIFEDGVLAAMIGERLGFPGYREISAVCTHPRFVGRGLARQLLAHLTNDIIRRGDTPFLHVSPTNDRAVRLYEQNGYRSRFAIAFTALRRA